MSRDPAQTAAPETETETDLERIAPSDPTPRGYDILVRVPGAAPAVARNDGYSDRVRCDHPPAAAARQLGEALKQLAEDCGRGRVVVLASTDLTAQFEEADFSTEAVIPGFYAGQADCAVLGCTLDPERDELGFSDEVAAVDALLEMTTSEAAAHAPVATERATTADAEAIAGLIDDTFEQYPTPSGVPAYIASAIDEGVPFRVVRDGPEVVACASADLVRSARTAELTDCATRPEYRGRGYMQAILLDLMGDLRDMCYPSAFTLARARIPGVNLAFQRLGFELRGRMLRSCRIGGGLEDMNVWSRSLVAP